MPILKINPYRFDSGAGDVTYINTNQIIRIIKCGSTFTIHMVNPDQSITVHDDDGTKLNQIISAMTVIDLTEGQDEP